MGLQLIEPGIHAARVRFTSQDNLVTPSHKCLDLVIRHFGCIRRCHRSRLDSVGIADLPEFCGSAEAVNHGRVGLSGVQLTNPARFARRIRRSAQHGLIQDLDNLCVAQVLSLEFGTVHKLIDDLRSCFSSGNQLVIPGFQSACVRFTSQDNIVAPDHIGFYLVLRRRRIGRICWVGGISGVGRIGRVCGVCRIRGIGWSNPICWLFQTNHKAVSDCCTSICIMHSKPGKGSDTCLWCELYNPFSFF